MATNYYGLLFVESSYANMANSNDSFRLKHWLPIYTFSSLHLHYLLVWFFYNVDIIIGIITLLLL